MTEKTSDSWKMLRKPKNKQIKVFPLSQTSGKDGLMNVR